MDTDYYNWALIYQCNDLTGLNQDVMILSRTQTVTTEYLKEAVDSINSYYGNLVSDVEEYINSYNNKDCS